MKLGKFAGISLVFVLLLASQQAFSQPIPSGGYGRMETVSIDTFDTASEMPYTWTTRASRFITEGFPKIEYFTAAPHLLRLGPDQQKPENEQKVLGVKFSFNRKADNWVELYPVDNTGVNPKGRQSYEIPLDGHVESIDCWVWGTNYNYDLEVMLRDINGGVHVFPAGNLKFYGWRDIVVHIPTSFKQAERLRSAEKSVTFIGFRIRSKPFEYVDDYQIFLDRLEYTTYRHGDFYDGFELSDANFGDPNSTSATQTNQEAGQ